MQRSHSHHDLLVPLTPSRPSKQPSVTLLPHFTYPRVHEAQNPRTILLKAKLTPPQPPSVRIQTQRKKVGMYPKHISSKRRINCWSKVTTLLHFGNSRSSGVITMHSSKFLSHLTLDPLITQLKKKTRKQRPLPPFLRIRPFKMAHIICSRPWRTYESPRHDLRAGGWAYTQMD